MPRQARIVIPDIPCHITQRGNHGQDVFYTPDDRKQYLAWLTQYSSRFGLDIIAYCLMTNHIHLVAIPRKLDSMSRTIQTVHMHHTQTINRIMGWDGHLWHSRYFSTALDDHYLWLAMRYVEQNPVRAGMVHHAWDYPWSSASFHCGLSTRDPVLHVDDRIMEMFENWDELLDAVPDKVEIETLRRRTITGVPCGDAAFLKRISRKVGYELADRGQGRPKKPIK
jgi:putative transposase